MRRSHAAAMSLLAAMALSSCNSASDVLQPSTPAATQSAQLPPPPSAGTTTAAPSAQSAPGAPATVTTGNTAAPTPAASPAPAPKVASLNKVRLQIAPIVGASVEAATPLTERLAERARERGIQLAGGTDRSVTHALKGYFSVLTEGKDTTVIYVWDVYDPAGNRLHRISGQQKTPSANGAEGWAAVSPAVMQAIADSTIEQLGAWLAGNMG